MSPALPERDRHQLKVFFTKQNETTEETPTFSQNTAKDHWLKKMFLFRYIQAKKAFSFFKLLYKIGTSFFKYFYN